MPWTNLSFETPGVHPGEADGWTGFASSTVVEIATYTMLFVDYFPPVDPIEYGWESFDGQWHIIAGWEGNEFDRWFFIAPDLEAALYDVAGSTTEAWEAFESLWESCEDDIWSFEEYNLEKAVYYVGDHPNTETFSVSDTTDPMDPEIGYDWDNSLWKREFEAGDLEPGIFSGNAFEDFEEDWRNNQDDEFAFVGGDLFAAHYGDGYGNPMPEFEPFESVFPERLFVANPATDELTLASAHALVADECVFVRNEGGILPDPMEERITYFVKTSATPIITVAESLGGATLDITDLGVGRHYIHADPQWYWIAELDV
jgi:hypothetical protein